jgi:hypothetical protein
MVPRGDPHNVMVFAAENANPSSIDVDAALTWLSAANYVVTANYGANSGLNDLTLARIEEHLAAHYIELGGGRQVASETLPDYAVRYAVSAGMTGLTATRNGRIVLELDTTGILADLNKPKPSFAVL